MKQIKIVLVTMFLMHQTSAAVVDHFQCKVLALTFDKNVAFSSQMNAYAMRQPIEGGTTALIELLAGGTKSNQVEFQISYRHAIQRSPDGRATRARQSLCINASANSAETGSGTLSCIAASPDAFAPDGRGWQDTPIKDGIPAFNMASFAPVTFPFPDGSKFRLNCLYLGTEE